CRAGDPGTPRPGGRGAPESGFDGQFVSGPSTNAPLGEAPQMIFTSEPTWKNGGVGMVGGRGSPGSSNPSSVASTFVHPGPPVSNAFPQSTSSGTPPVVSL